MDERRCVEVLRAHNEWRRYDGFTGEPGAPAMVNPTELGQALDHAIATIERVAGESSFQIVGWGRMFDGRTIAHVSDGKESRFIYSTDDCEWGPSPTLNTSTFWENGEKITLPDPQPDGQEG